MCRVSWINGIAHTPSDVSEMAAELSKLFSDRVHYLHNPSSMSSPADTLGYMRDLSQCTAQKLGKITNEVNELTSHLRSLVSSLGSKGRLVHIAHSQGALITYLAARHLTPEECSKIEVICFGGAAAITALEFPHFRRRVNYYSVNDPLLHVVPKAAQALTSGLLFGSNNPSDEPEYVFLSAKYGDPIVDHGLLGPTYSDAIASEGRRYASLRSGVRSQLERGQDRVDELAHLIILAVIAALRRLVQFLVAVRDAVRAEFADQKLLLTAVSTLGMSRLGVGEERCDRARRAARAWEVTTLSSYVGLRALSFAVELITSQHVA
ncbi:hypothetical protein TeGR_g15232 [Tetraparma gracilis]|uniref:Fungal lipase-like domain-containing protein n=1 Tax=Tetraparma gracilis TaxID=2962635 RepID=A0ABQ6NBA2_9STRA|nr:hypothetical protein TeGR_g15232 [Tetraparma gracilis]